MKPVFIIFLIWWMLYILQEQKVNPVSHALKSSESHSRPQPLENQLQQLHFLFNEDLLAIATGTGFHE